MKKYFLFVLVWCFASLSFAQQKFPKTLVVAQNGEGNYKTIQEAVNSVRDLGKQEVKIYIRKGIYREKVVVPSWKTNITLIGEDASNTIITHADYSGKDYPAGKDLFGLEKFSTYTSYTLLVQGNGFTAQDLTIENTSGRVGQAVALHIEGDKAIVKNCRILGNQDTLYAATPTSRQYYLNCYITGTTDFIFGEATAVFKNCRVKSLSDSYITAAATTEAQQYGFVFIDCKLIADSAVSKVFLGRPWRPYAKTVFINTDMGKHILPAGWHPWPGDEMFPDKDKTAYYAEYKSFGAGGGIDERVRWSKQLTEKQVKNYSVEAIFINAQGSWKPESLD